jgi:hypothetical protein
MIIHTLTRKKIFCYAHPFMEDLYLFFIHRLSHHLIIFSDHVESLHAID